MKERFKKRDKLLVTLAVICFLAICYFIKLPCVFQYLTDMPCITCGMTRAWMSVLRLDFLAAFRYHELFWTVPILYLFFWFDGALFKKKKVDMAVFALILVALCIRWLIILPGHLTLA